MYRLLFLLGLTTLSAAAAPIFPYPVQISRLKNGLSVVSVRFNSPGIVTYHSIVRTGSRNEVEPGKSGFAHFFEHLMFRGTPTISKDRFQGIFQAYGADLNATVDEDRSLFHITASNTALPEMVRVEADRFQNLAYSLTDFQQEAGAVLGEYEKQASDPVSWMYEVLVETAFTQHPYRHTTIGYRKDIVAMPSEYDYSVEFFKRWYRPENTTLLVVGDVDHATLMRLVEPAYGGWRPGVASIAIPVEPPQTKERRVALTWKGQTDNHLFLAYHVPAFDPASKDTAALDILTEAVFGSNSPLYKKLILVENRAESIRAGSAHNRDPYLFNVHVRVPARGDLKGIEQAIAGELTQVGRKGIGAQRLSAIKSHLRYRTALSLSTPDAVANTLGEVIQLTGDPQSLNRLYDTYEAVTDEDLKRVLKQYFQPKNRTVVTLVEGQKTGKIDGKTGMHTSPPPLTPPPTKGKRAETDTERTTAGASPTPTVPVSLPTPRSPLVSLRIGLRLGTQNDPPGKEGITALTARLMMEGGSKTLTYSQLLEKLYPIAADYDVTIDKEVTTFDATVHEDKVDEFLALFLDPLTNPRFDSRDVNRLKKEAQSYLTSHLRGSDDESLGKWGLQLMLYPSPHPYGHVDEGTLRGVRSLTVKDLKRYYQEAFLTAPLTVMVTGGNAETIKGTIQKRLARAGTPVPTPTLPSPAALKDLEVTVLEKENNSTAISIGLPLNINRSDDDFYRLALATSAFGEHRKFIGRLMRHMRVDRGLNYGDYAYAENFIQDGGGSFAEPNIPRRQQYFSIWIRPVSHRNAIFALRQAIRELNLLVEKGLTPEEFASANKFLVNYSKLWVQTASRRLGFELDGIFYGKKSIVDELDARLPTMKLEEVNTAIKKHLQGKNLAVSIVTHKDNHMLEKLLAGGSTPIFYDTRDVPNNILEEDRVIMNYPLTINKERSKTLPVSQLFEH